MAVDPVDLLGGDSVYCINKNQLADAVQLTEHDPVSGLRIRKVLETIETSLSRNERASLAFVLIERLRDRPD